MTSKEPMVAFAIACAVRTCSSELPKWAQSLVIGALVLGLTWVRVATAPLVLLALAISFEFRKGESPRRRGPWMLLLAIVGVIVLYVSGSGSTAYDETNNPLAMAGYDKMDESSSIVWLSSHSLLRQLGSPNRMVDVFYVPIRGVANILCPLYLNPLSQLATIDGCLIWLSAGLCFFAVLAVFLRLLDREPWTRTRAVLFGVFVLGSMTLGLSGLIHERYRSLVVAALLPLGMRSVREEVSVHGPRRLIVGAAVLPVFFFLLYEILRQFA